MSGHCDRHEEEPSSVLRGRYNTDWPGYLMEFKHDQAVGFDVVIYLFILPSQMASVQHITGPIPS